MLECAFLSTLFFVAGNIHFVPLFNYGGDFMADVHFALICQDSAINFYPPATNIILNPYLPQWLIQTANIQY